MSNQLIQRWLKTGDEQAAEAIFQAHHARVFQLAYALLGDVNSAEHVMQDTMIFALARTNLFDQTRTSFIAWLDTITVRRCRDRERHLHPHRTSTGHPKDGTEYIANPNSRSEIIPGGNHHEIWQALDQLSLKLREAFVLHYLGGHDGEELAEILHCPLSTAQSRVRVAYEQLYKLLRSAGMPATSKENQQ